MRVCLTAAAIAIIACSSKPTDRAPAGSASQPVPAPAARDAAPVPEPAPTYYRIEATVDDLGKVPFLVAVRPDKPEGWIWSPDEQLPLVVVSREPLVLRIPVRGVELHLVADGTDGKLSGQWRVAYYYKRDFDIVAEPVAALTTQTLFPSAAQASVDVSGEWRFDIHDFGVGRGSFRQQADGTVLGTIIPPEVGDLRHLTGRVTGDVVRLSAFDGIHGFLVEGTVDQGKTVKGTWLIAGIGLFPFTATREDAPRTHVEVKARMRPGKTRVTLPELDAPQFAGKPVIVDYFGSWCPVCIDLTPELVRLRKEHEATGLQILSIALEPEGDEVETKRRLDEFRAAFGVTWPFTIKYGDDFHAALPKELLDATGFPVTLFLRRDHTVAAVHTGFISRASAKEHAEVVKLFDRLTAEITSPTK